MHTILARFILRLANANAADYLVSLNLRKLNENKRPADADPRAYYTELREKAKLGPLFHAGNIELIRNLDIEMDKQETQWLASCNETSKRQPTLRDLRTVLDYIRAEKPDLKGLTYQQAQKNSEAWHKQFKNKANLGSYTTKSVDMDFGDGYTMVNVPAEDCKTEGNFMGHCVGSYENSVKRGECTIYSLRDAKNEPHVTIEVVPSRTRRPRGGLPVSPAKTKSPKISVRVEQIQGKENKQPIEKYHKYIDQWLTQRGLHSDDTSRYITDIDRLTAMAQNKNNEVKAQAAGNIRTPPAVLVELAKSKNCHVVSCLAWNKAATEEVLTYIARRKDIERLQDDGDVACILVCNPKLPQSEGKRLLSEMKDLDDRVSSAYEDGDDDYGNEFEVPEYVTAILATNKSEYIRAVAARYVKDPKILRKLLSDKDSTVRQNAISNPNIPMDYASDLAANAKKPVEISRLVCNTAVSNEVLEIVKNRKDLPRGGPSDLQELAAKILSRRKLRAQGHDIPDFSSESDEDDEEDYSEDDED